MTAPVRFSRHGHVALVMIDNPPVNALGPVVRKDLDDLIGQIEADADIRSVVIACAGHSFAAGADISEIGKERAPPLLPDLIDRIEASAKTWVAAIHGFCLGGGFELALGCAYRIAKPDTVFALPEVSLGLIPGAGGTVRLPLLIGTRASFDIITQGTRFSAVEGLDYGCIDRLSHGDLVEDALAFAATAPRRTPLTDRGPARRDDTFDWATEIDRIRQNSRGQESFVAAAEALHRTATMPARAALAQERATFRDLVRSPQSEAMRYLFFAERKAFKPAAITGANATLIKKVGVVGDGAVAAAVADQCAQAGIRTVLVAHPAQAVGAGAAAPMSNVVNPGWQAAERNAGSPCGEPFLSHSDTLEALASCDLVIEALPEDPDLKRSVLGTLDGLVAPGTVLATHTTCFRVQDLATLAGNSGRIIGMTFSLPLETTNLVEIVRAAGSRPDALATGFAFVRRIGRQAVLSGDRAGFIGNRIFRAFRDEAIRMQGQGTSPDDIDAAARNYGLALGPFERGDILRQSRGHGLRDDVDRQPQPAPDVQDATGADAGKTGSPPSPPRTSQDIIDRLMARVATEASAILQDGVAEAPVIIDIVLANGLGFPRWRGGPMFAEDLALRRAG